MILNLNNLISQVRGLLFDPDGLIWSLEQLTDFIRLGLQELQTIATLKLTLEGLDGEETTALEPAVTVLLVRMVVVRAVEMRWLDRTETFHPDPQHSNFNLGWLEHEKELIQKDFENLRKSTLQRSLLPPYPTQPVCQMVYPIFLGGGIDA
jgi:hypothetical protein